MRAVIQVPAILLMISVCSGTHQKLKWTPSLDEKLLEIYYRTSPRKYFHKDRVKKEWIREVPMHSEVKERKIRRRALNLIRQDCDNWERRSETDKEKLRERLRNIYATVRKENQADQEEFIFKELLNNHPEYRNESRMIRNVVHKWYKRSAFRHGELERDQVMWTPQLKADLLYIAEKVRFGTSDIRDRIKTRWSQMHHDLNVKAETLVQLAYILKKKGYKPSREEEKEAERKYNSILASGLHDSKRILRISEGEKLAHRYRWSNQYKADLLYIYDENRNKKGEIMTSIQERWGKMHPELKYMTGLNLVQTVKRFQRQKFRPSLDEMAQAKAKYDSLSPASKSHSPNVNAVDREVVPRALELTNRKGKEIMLQDDSMQFHYHYPDTLDVPVVQRSEQTAQSSGTSHYSQLDPEALLNSHQYQPDNPTFSPLPYRDFYDTHDSSISHHIMSNYKVSHHSEIEEPHSSHNIGGSGDPTLFQYSNGTQHSSFSSLLNDPHVFHNYYEHV